METEQGKEKGKMEKEARLTWKKTVPGKYQFVIQTPSEGRWETNPALTRLINDQGLIPGKAMELVGQKGAFLSGRIVQTGPTGEVITTFEASNEK